jgi:hypothetical protein
LVAVDEARFKCDGASVEVQPFWPGLVAPGRDCVLMVACFPRVFHPRDASDDGIGEVRKPQTTK